MLIFKKTIVSTLLLASRGDEWPPFVGIDRLKGPALHVHRHHRFPLTFQNCTHHRGHDLQSQPSAAKARLAK